jgi:hypothetical protein
MWHVNARKVVIYGDEAQEGTDEVIAHEASHAVYDDMDEKIGKLNEEYNKLVADEIDRAEKEGAPWFKFEKPKKPDYKGLSIQSRINVIRDRQHQEVAEMGYFEFQKAVQEEGGITHYARSWKDHQNYYTESLAEISYYVLSDDIPWREKKIKMLESDYPQQFKAWKKIMKRYGVDV